VENYCTRFRKGIYKEENRILRPTIQIITKTRIPYF